MASNKTFKKRASEKFTQKKYRNKKSVSKNSKRLLEMRGGLEDKDLIDLNLKIKKLDNAIIMLNGFSDYADEKVTELEKKVTELNKKVTELEKKNNPPVVNPTVVKNNDNIYYDDGYGH
jgi:chromosome segregation ATPase